MVLRWSALALAAALLAGCASREEVLLAQAEADRFSCLEQRFEEGTDAYGLCRLILQTNRRLDTLSSRLAFVENDVRRIDLLGVRSSRRPCRC